MKGIELYIYFERFLYNFIEIYIIVLRGDLYKYYFFIFIVFVGYLRWYKNINMCLIFLWKYLVIKSLGVLKRFVLLVFILLWWIIKYRKCKVILLSLIFIGILK